MKEKFDNIRFTADSLQMIERINSKKMRGELNRIVKTYRKEHAPKKGAKNGKRT